jgi:hypothetical protein
MSKNALRKNLASFLGSGGHRFDGSLFSTTTQPVPIGQGQQVEIGVCLAGGQKTTLFSTPQSLKAYCRRSGVSDRVSDVFVS